MTTPQPAALPENELRALYQRHELATTGLVLSDFKRIVSDVLAALQAQPAAAGVSDAKELHDRLMRIADGVEVYGVPSKRLRASQLQEIARAILALRPQAVPMTEDEFVACLVKASCVGVVKMSYDSGPYDVTRPSINASKLKEAFEAHHGITAPAGGEG